MRAFVNKIRGKAKYIKWITLVALVLRDYRQLWLTTTSNFFILLSNLLAHLCCHVRMLGFPFLLFLGSGGQWIEKKRGVKCELTTYVRENWKRMKVTFQTHNGVNTGDSIPRKRTLEDDKIRGRNSGEEGRSPGLVFNSSRCIILS
jgi:hypothetical protein